MTMRMKSKATSWKYDGKRGRTVKNSSLLYCPDFKDISKNK